jgi:hypothetical protein
MKIIPETHKLLLYYYYVQIFGEIYVISTKLDQAKTYKN